MDLQLPIEHISYSALREYCSNRWLFKKHYILNDWSDVSTSASMLTGTGFHKVMEMYYSGLDITAALAKGYEAMDSEQHRVNWAEYKTTSLAKCKEEMAQTVNFYFEEEVSIGEVLATEKVVLCDFSIGQDVAPLPLKAKTDMISRKDNKLHIWDWKTVSTHSDVEKEDANYILQAMFNFQTIKASYNEEPAAAHFVEVKKSKNRDGGSQVQVYSIEFDKHPEYHTYFGKMYTGLIIELSNPDIQFLPNFGDMLGGEEAWKDFTSEAMDFNLPKRISHRASLDVQVDKSQYQKNYVASKEPSTPEEQIVAKLLEFGIPMDFQQSYKGVAFTLYTFKPSRGVSMKKVKSFEDDLSLALGAESVRIEAPLRGTKLVGVEVSQASDAMIEWSEKLLQKGTLNLPVGQDVYKEDHFLDLARAPHLLVAGATGAGKSVFLNCCISSLIAQNTENDLGLILIDPKRTEFTMFEDSTHLEAAPIIEVPDAHAALKWAVFEMEERYKQMKDLKVRSIDDYNKKAHMKKIVIVIDELADLLLNKEIGVSEAGEPIKYSGEIENMIIRLAQKSRAAGIHLIVATQRPSVDVVTGILKANFPTRVAFMTSSAVDSGVILDTDGAEKLVGNGDLLLKNPRRKHIIRLQGYYI